MAQRIDLGGLWKNGDAISGNLGSARIVIYPNDRKANERAPDFNMYLYPGKRQEEWENKKAQAAPHAEPEDTPQPYNF